MEIPFDDTFNTKPYPQNVENASFSKNGEQKTMPYQGVGLPEDITDAALETKPYQLSEQTIQRSSTHNIGTGDSIELNSIRYEILNILSGDGKTSEAVIYKVKDPKGKIFVLKLYYEFPDTHLEPNSDTLQRIRELEANELLYLFDFGTGPNKHLNKYCFEISSYAEGGDLLRVKDFSGKYTSEFIREQVVPFIHKGLQALHTERIYHCDLKPQNVFYLDKAQTKIVIGDYGSAKSFDKTSEKELSYTTLTRGTEFYLAPEQAFGIVSEKNDYYSLGMIVLHLLYPDEVNRKNLRRIFERRTKGLPIIDFDEKYEMLNRLIEGLTLQDYNNRWGAVELEKWLAGEEVTVNYGGASRFSRIEVGSTVIKSGSDLVNFVKEGQDFYNVLIDDKDVYANLLAWVRMMQGEQGMSQFDGMISHYKKYFGAEYVKEAILFYFDPFHEIQAGAEKFCLSEAENPADGVIRFFGLTDELWKITDFGQIRLWFFKLEFALRRLRERSVNQNIAAIDSMLKTMASVIGINYDHDFSEMKASLFIQLKNSHLPELFHKFNPERGFKDMQGNSYSTLFEVSEFLKLNAVTGKMDLLQYEKTAFVKTRSKEEVEEYVEFCNDLSEFFFEKDEDFNLLTSLVLRFNSIGYSQKFIDGVLRHYRKAENFIHREVILRLIKPELPVSIGGEYICFFNPGNFDAKVREFFIIIENERFTKPLEEIRQKFFCFEFSLMQVARHDQVMGKSLVDPVFKKLQETTHGNLPDWVNLRAAIFQEVDDKKLVAILHRFNPARVFCTHNGDFLGTTEEIAIYYLQNPLQFTDDHSINERESFFKKSGNNRLLGLSLRDFVINVFRSETTFTGHISEISFDENEVNDVTIYYHYEISLQNYLHSRGLESDVSFKSETINEITIKRKQLDTVDELFEKFAGRLKKRHAFGILSELTQVSFNETYSRARKQEFWEYFFLMPRYIIYLLPAFGLLYLSAGYLMDYSLFKHVSYNIAPTLNLVAARMVASSASSLLFAAYFLNLIVAIMLMIPLLSLRRKKGRFSQFNIDYGPLMGRTSLIFLFVPVIFVGAFLVLEAIFGMHMISAGSVFQEISTLQFTILLYIAFMFFQVLYVIRAFFKVSKKIRLLPLFFSIIMYLAAGYFALFKYTLI